MGPTHLIRPNSTQKYWANLTIEDWANLDSIDLFYFLLFGQTWPSYLGWARIGLTQHPLHEQWSWIIIHAYCSCVNNKMWIIIHVYYLRLWTEGEERRRGMRGLPGSRVVAVVTCLAEDGGRDGGARQSWRREEEEKERNLQGREV
jgi:hypothetical protein